MKYLKHFLLPFHNTFFSLLFTCFVFGLSVGYNLSTHFMGVDLKQEMFQLINAEYAKLLLLVNAKILLIYFLFFLSLDFIISRYWTKNKSPSIISILFWLMILLILWFHSITKYPQIYGEFFYYRHTYLQPLLYFLTSIAAPVYFETLILILISVHFLLMVYKLILSKNSVYLSTITFTVLFLLFFSLDYLYGWIALLFLYQFVKNLNQTLSILKIIVSLVLLLAIGLSPFIYKKLNTKLLTHYNQAAPLFIISADSLRMDRIGFLRDNQSVTPHLDNFIKDSIVFKDHHTTIPRTFPSWADLLSGEYSMSHKIRDMFPAPEEKKNLGTANFQTIGHYLRQKNFRSAVFSGFAGDIFPRADFGFDEVYAPNFNARLISVYKSIDVQFLLIPILTGSLFGGGNFFDEVNGFSTYSIEDKLLNQIKTYVQKNSDHPFFVTLFYSTTHFPYTPPYPFYNKYGDPKYRGKYKYMKFVDPTKDEKLNNAEIEQIRSVYDNSVHAIDHNFGQLMQYLKENQLYEKSLIVVTGDHGESLYEDVHSHGHGEHLRGEHVTKVPLMIKLPENSPYKEKMSKEFKGITSSIDVLPTILEYYGIQVDKTFSGRSLFGTNGKSHWTDDRSVYTETGIWFTDAGDHFFQKQRIVYPNILKLHTIVPTENHEIMIVDPFHRDTIAFAKHRAMLTSKYKLIYIPTREGVVWELYDRENDPLNQTNLYEKNSVSNRLSQELYKLVQQKEKAKIAGEYILPPPIQSVFNR